jgi:hypothetical protein
MTTGAEPIFHYGLSNGWVPHVRPGVRGTKKTGDPDFLYAAPPMFACAAFIKESRMKFLYSTKPHRKDGRPGFPVRGATHVRVCGFH